MSNRNNEKPSTSSHCNHSDDVAKFSDDNNSSNYIPLATAIPFEMIEHGDIIANIITRVDNARIFPEPSAPPKEEVEEDERELIFAITGLNEIENSNNDKNEEEWTWYIISDDDTKLPISKDDIIPSSTKIKDFFQQQKTNSILVSKVAYEKVTSIIDYGTKSVNKAAFSAALIANEKYKCYHYRPRPSCETQIDSDNDSSNNDNNEEELAWYIISNEDFEVPSPSDDATHSPKEMNNLNEQKTKCVFASKVAYEKLTSMIDYGSKSFNEAKVIVNQKYYCYYYRPKPSSEREVDCNSYSNHVENPFEIELKEFGTTV